MGEILGLPVIHLDAVFWRPGWVRWKRAGGARCDCEVGHLLGRAREDGVARVVEVRQAGVGLDDDRQLRRLHHAREKRQHLIGSEAAVQRDGIGSGGFKDDCGRLRLRAGDIHAARKAERAAREDGQIGD